MQEDRGRSEGQWESAGGQRGKAVTDPSGWVSTAFYDADGNLIRVTDGDGTETASPAGA
jgi:YD repeat-containing protein